MNENWDESDQSANYTSFFDTFMTLVLRFECRAQNYNSVNILPLSNVIQCYYSIYGTITIERFSNNVINNEKDVQKATC